MYTVLGYQSSKKMGFVLFLSFLLWFCKECIAIIYLMPLVIYHMRNQLQLFFSWCNVLFLLFELVRSVSSLNFEHAKLHLQSTNISFICLLLWKRGQSSQLWMDYHPSLLFLNLSNRDVHVNSNIYRAYLHLEIVIACQP